MNKALTIFLLTAFGLAAQAPASTGGSVRKPAAKAAAVKKATTPLPAPVMTIPKDAVAKSDGTFLWTDKQGKQWTFVRTPFGVMKNPAVISPQADAAPVGVKAVDEGDKVRFETPSPFGVMTREKNKSDLTDEERSLFNSQNPGPETKQD